MPKEIISKKTRIEFREFLVSWTCGIIEKLFEAEDIPYAKDYDPQLSGQRRTLVERYYRSLDFYNWHDITKLIRVYEEILYKFERDIANESSTQGSIDKNKAVQDLENLIRCLEKDRFRYENKKIISMTNVPAGNHLTHTINSFDCEYLAVQLKRMEEAVISNTDLAIGTAKEIVETCCKTILTEKGMFYDKEWDIGKLVKETFKSLQLSPDDIEDNKKTTQAARQIVGSFASIIQGMAELRNLYGTGHGKDNKFKSLPPRYAKLTAGAATTLVTFLFETFQEREKRKLNP